MTEAIPKRLLRRFFVRWRRIHDDAAAAVVLSSASPKTPLGQAVGYAMRPWKTLQTFLHQIGDSLV